MIVDCDTCEVRDVACGDCVVTVLLGMAPPEQPVELDDAERTAIGVLSESGLVPPLRLVGIGGAGAGDAENTENAENAGRSRDSPRRGAVPPGRGAVWPGRGPRVAGGAG